MLDAELKLHNSIPIAMEWSLEGVTISHPDGRSLEFTGYIDRVDVFLPFGSGKKSSDKDRKANQKYRLEKWEKQKHDQPTFLAHGSSKIHSGKLNTWAALLLQGFFEKIY